MEAITFKTELGNSYLYSPARKVVIPIPLYVHEDLLSGNLNNNYFLSILKKEDTLITLIVIIQEESLKKYRNFYKGCITSCF